MSVPFAIYNPQYRDLLAVHQIVSYPLDVLGNDLLNRFGVIAGMQ